MIFNVLLESYDEREREPQPEPEPEPERKTNDIPRIHNSNTSPIYHLRFLLLLFRVNHKRIVLFVEICRRNII